MNPHVMLKDPDQIRAVESLRRLDQNGYLYAMDCRFDYLKAAGQLVQFFDAGCSSFVQRNSENEMVLYRNYDYGHHLHNDRRNPVTGINCVIHAQSPSARYESIGTADAFWTDPRHAGMVAGKADDGVTDISAFAMLPLVCMDGMNEAGLCVSIMALCVESDWQETDYEKAVLQAEANRKVKKYVVLLQKPGELPDRFDKWSYPGCLALNEADHKAWRAEMPVHEQKNQGRPTLYHPILMRQMLDLCADTKEAAALASSVNVKAAVPGSDYHILIADASGNSVMLEWEGDEMKVLPAKCGTNYRLNGTDPFRGTDRRYECIQAGLERFSSRMPEKYGLDLPRLVCQEPGNGADRGKTQYSCIYHLEQKTMQIFSFGDYSHSWTFSLHGELLREE